MSDIDEQIERLKRCEYLKESEVKTLCDKAREILIDESNVQRVDAPVTVCCFLAVSMLMNAVYHDMALCLLIDMWRYSRSIPRFD
jgi:hypothetical protein